ncbi:MAG: YlmC/YmxH family sporulation protein [Clostridiales bacterium]|nr:YlmC/YmxH family sporulation protein [Clostridiales bacterium]
MYRFSELRCKEIINSKTGARMGFAEDVFFDLQNGKILSFSVPVATRFMGFLISRDYYMIPFEDIERIGDDVIIISSTPQRCSPKNDRGFWEKFLSWFK